MSDAPTGPIASWEKHTKGIGSKLLQKFGFKGRLGANEDGIAHAIEVSVRPTNVGLGFGEAEKPKPAVESLRQKGSQERGPESRKPKARSDYPSKSEVDSFVANYRSIINSDLSEDAPKMKIRDLSGGYDFSLVGLEAEPIDKTVGHELVAQVNKIAESERLALSQCGDRLRIERKQLSTIQNTLNETRRMRATQASKVHAYQVYLAKLKQLQSLVAEHRSQESMSDDKLLDSVMRIGDEVVELYTDTQTSSPDLATEIGLLQQSPHLLESLLLPTAQRSLYALSTVLVVLDSCRERLILHCQIHGDVRLTTPTIERAFNTIAERTYSPIVAQVFASQWQPRIDPPAELVSVCSHLRQLLTTTALQRLAEESILPKLLQAVQQWQWSVSGQDQKQDLPLHVIILPWLPLLAEKLQVLFPEIRRKLGHVLRHHWDVYDSTLLGLLVPWQQIFDSRSMENLVARIVVHQLVDVMRDKFHVNPAQQDIKPLTAVLAWCTAVVPAAHVQWLLAGEFAPKFISVLVTWLSVDEPSYEEISVWYHGWKQYFPAQYMTSSKSLLRRGFFLAVDLISHRARVGRTQFVADTRGLVSSLTQTNYHALVARFGGLALASTSAPPTSRTIDMQATQTSTSLKEVLQVLAEKNGLIFAPKFGKSVRGNAIWVFGELECFLSNDVVYVHVKDDKQDDWMPMSLQALVDRAAFA